MTAPWLFQTGEAAEDGAYSEEVTPVQASLLQAASHLHAKEEGQGLVQVPVLLFYDRIPYCGYLSNAPISMLLHAASLPW